MDGFFCDEAARGVARTPFPDWRLRRICCLSLIFSLVVCLRTEAQCVVAPDGDDNQAGTADAPFATLDRARRAVREAFHGGRTGTITVQIREGTYRLKETVRFGIEDSAPSESRVVYQAWPGERPIFTGSVPVTGWRRPAAEDDLQAFPEVARPHLWVADVADVYDLRRQGNQLAAGAGLPRDPADNNRFFTVYAGGRRLSRARGPGFRPVARTPQRRGSDQSLLRFPEGYVRDWPQLADAELLIIPCSYWIMNILRFGAVDEAAGVATMATPGTYSLGRNGMADRPSCWIENVPAVLDEPGEWYLNAAGGQLWLWPEDGGGPADVEIPILTELIRIEGAIDYDGPRDQPVRGISFRGLTFTGADRLPWHGDTGWGLQHDWEMFDRPSALVRLRGAEDCEIRDCTFEHSAHAAIRLDLHAQRNLIQGNHIHHIGGVGILLAGYGPGTKDVNTDNRITNNAVHHIGDTYWGSPGIFVWQSGRNRIDHNLVHHTPYTGIVVSGRISWRRDGRGECARTCRFDDIESVLGEDFQRPNWQRREQFLHARTNLVERNEIHTVMEVTGDGNAVYVSGCGTGNVVRENYCHDAFGRYMNAVLRCDDDQHGTTFERNICVRTRGYAEGIINKGANRVIGNIVADLRPTYHHRALLVLVRYPQHGAVIRENIFYATRPSVVAVTEAGRINERVDPPRLRDTDCDRNVYWNTADESWGDEHLQTYRPQGVETNSKDGDPLFRNPRQDDFYFRDGSSALALGIAQPVEVNECGLQQPWRSRYSRPRLWTWIEPNIAQVLKKPVEITMTSSDPQATIHYTLDGSEPDASSPVYDGPFVLADPAIVRARSLSARGEDPCGDGVRFYAPPPPIVHDFEGMVVGAPPEQVEVKEEDDTHTVRVTDDDAASGDRALRFLDGPGQTYPFNPHIYYRTSLDEGRLQTSFAIKVEQNSDFYVQCREYPAQGSFVRGPAVRIMPGGRVMHEEAEVMQIPLHTWVEFRLSCLLGDAADGRYQMTVTVPGQSPRQFADLMCEAGFRTLEWFGFVSVGEAEASTLVDDVACVIEE